MIGRVRIWRLPTMENGIKAFESCSEPYQANQITRFYRHQTTYIITDNALLHIPATKDALSKILWSTRAQLEARILEGAQKRKVAPAKISCQRMERPLSLVEASVSQERQRMWGSVELP